MATTIIDISNSVYNYSGRYVGYYFYLEVILNSQSTANNTSNITVNHYGQANTSTGGGYSGFSTPSSTITVQGSNKRTGACDDIPTSGTKVLLGTWTGDVTHASDGTLSLAVSASYAPNTSSYSYLPQANTLSKTVSVATIPRASDVSVASSYSIANTSSSLSATISPKANFYHRWKWSIGSYTSDWTTLGQSSATQTISVANTSMLSQLPSSTSGSVTFTVQTHNGNAYSSSTLVGSKTATSTVSVNTSNIKPSVSQGGISADNTPIAGYLIAGHSQAKMSYATTNSYGATSVTTYFSTNYGSMVASSSSATSGMARTNVVPSSVNNYTLRINSNAKDSRGAVSNLVYQEKIVYGYQTPTATLRAYRVADSTSTTEDGAGEYVYVTFSGAVRSSINSQNSIQSTSCTYSGSISGTATNGQHIPLSDVQTVTFTLTVTDKVASSTVTASVGSASYPLDLYDSGGGVVGASVGGNAVAGEFNSYIPFLTKNSFKQIGRHYVHNTSGSIGTDGYIRFAQLTVTLAYRSGMIHFLVSRRNRIPENVSVKFSGNDVASSTPTLYVDRYPSEYFMVKDSDGVFGLYARKTEGYDQIDVLQYDMGDYMNQGVSILWSGTQVSSIPSGAIMGILYGGINENFSYWHYANQTSNTELSAGGIAPFATKVAGDSSGVITYSGGIFTINRAGLYRIHAHLGCQAITNNRVWLQLHNNSSTIAQWISYTSFVTVDMSKVIRADVGERIWIVATEATRINNGGIGPSFMEIEWIGD